MKSHRRAVPRRILSVLIAAALFVVLAASPAHARTQRIAGADRYLTSLHAAKEFLKLGRHGHTAIAVSGTKWPDAISAAPLAGTLRAPIILVPPDGLSRNATHLLRYYNITDIIIAGGTAALSKKAERSLKESFQNVSRLSGADRYHTSVLQSELSVLHGQNSSPRRVIIASGSTYHAALSAAPASFRDKIPLLLTAPDSLPDEVRDFIKKHSPNEIVIIGNPSDVSKKVESSLRSLTASLSRIEAADPFELSIEVSASFSLPEPTSPAVGLASSALPFDALSSVPLLGSTSAALYFVDPHAARLPKSVSDALWDISPDPLLVFGGPAAIPQALITEADHAIAPKSD